VNLITGDSVHNGVVVGFSDWKGEIEYNNYSKHLRLFRRRSPTAECRVLVFNRQITQSDVVWLSAPDDNFLLCTSAVSTLRIYAMM